MNCTVGTVGAQKRRAHRLAIQQQNQIDYMAGITMPPDTAERRKISSPGEGCFAKQIISLNVNLAKYRGVNSAYKGLVENPPLAWKTTLHDYARIYELCTYCILRLQSNLYRFVKN